MLPHVTSIQVSILNTELFKGNVHLNCVFSFNRIEKQALFSPF